MSLGIRQHTVAVLCGALIVGACATPGNAPVGDATLWPSSPPPARDVALEQRIDRILAGMSLAQKVGQMTQAEIQSVTPEDVRTYALGSVLNGGGSWPGKARHAGVAEWAALSARFRTASLGTALGEPVPLIWGTDAVHGHNNVHGATLFPHNVGLGAARDPELVGEIGRAVGRAVRATGIDWTFAPTVALAQNPRWGRTYESFGQDPALVHDYARAYVAGLQGQPGDPGSIVATAKHFVGDGGTRDGVDQGVAQVDEATLAGVHAQGYIGALAAGVQTVMASFNSWQDPQRGIDYGKMHGNRYLLTDILKGRLGFDGFVVSDWDGIAQLPGCSKSQCPAAINAGVDMLMVPEDWRAFITNTVADVEAGRIAPARIDDAVRRILRVKLRAGLFERRGADPLLGKPEALQASALARRAVRESLVLLDSRDGLLPLPRQSRLLVVGKGADSMAIQCGGWSMTWQGEETDNRDFPNGDTVLAGLRAAAGGRVVFSATGSDVRVEDFDAVVAVVGEAPYAEMQGDVLLPHSLRHSERYPEDLKVLQQVSGHGVPVITVLFTGRPVWVEDLRRLSDAFVVAWLPGTEGGGIADLLVAGAGVEAAGFRGRLPMRWPLEESGRAEGPWLSAGYRWPDRGR
jgi:beta-glucosidase